MLSKRKSLLVVLCMLGVILLSAAPLFAATDEMEITGIVYAAEWDANGNVASVVIETDEGEEILVSKSGKGMELLKLEAVLVRASGSIITDENGRKTITVTKYMIQE
jgi:hypothetical protein